MVDLIINLPTEVASIIVSFVALFSRRVWYQAQVLIAGAMLATEKHTVTSILAVMGLSKDKPAKARK
ncbi:hypothetical protein BV378_05650 [Nostoc sp. RF31YmG]|nr:hypothetical protein BV378_05650 [Nostoc sp. RF31YmG]